LQLVALARVDGLEQEGVQLARVERQRAPHELVDEPAAELLPGLAALTLPRSRGRSSYAAFKLAQYINSNSTGLR
jgi:hypothetical protein